MWRIIQSDDVPQVLDSLDLPGIVKYMKSDACRNVFVMAGAGISTSAGIPDFRSPDTGLYANLARLNLPYPEAVFDISFFGRNPRPFYVLAHELAPGRFRPTIAHSFIRLLADKGLLHTCFTQNIDTLERAAGVPGDKIIEAHGSFADQHCVSCGASYPSEKIKIKIEEQEIPICERSGCGGYVKPDIVFFGESLPEKFFYGIRHLRDADLLIVMGTSLTVHPFASLTELVPEECPRLLINLDHVGGWGSRVNDVACLMPCDRAVRELTRLLGWEKDLDALWAETDLSRKKQTSAPGEDRVKVKILEKLEAKEKEAVEKEQAEERKGEAEKEEKKGKGIEVKVEEKEKKVEKEAKVEEKSGQELREKMEGKRGEQKARADEEKRVEGAKKEAEERPEEGAKEEAKEKAEKKVEKVEEKVGEKVEEKAEERPKGKPKPRDDGKKVSEDFLANIVDKLAESIGEVTLEDEEESRREDVAEQKVTEGDSARPRESPESVQPDTSSKVRDSSGKSAGTESPRLRDPLSSEESSKIDPSSQAGKLDH